MLDCTCELTRALQTIAKLSGVDRRGNHHEDGCPLAVSTGFGQKQVGREGEVRFNDGFNLQVFFDGRWEGWNTRWTWPEGDRNERFRDFKERVAAGLVEVWNKKLEAEERGWGLRSMSSS